MMAEIAELAPIATKLNRKSDQINRTIATINQKLAKMNLGIEVWLDTPLSAEKGDEDNVGLAKPWQLDDNGIRCREAFYLGYGRLGDTWELLAKEVVEEERTDGTIVTVGEPRRASVLKGTRNARLAALEQLPALMDALKAEGGRLLKLIDDAEKTAQSL
jgi:hypothetical protein